MEVKKAIKKIVALGIGTSMLGATMLGAMAADLNMYPEPFIMDGVFNGVIVVGDDAQADDIVGAIDVATGLQFSAKTTGGTGGGASTVVVTGDSYAIEEGGNQLNPNEEIDTIVASIDDNELEALSGGTLRNQKGTFDYEEELAMPAQAQVKWTSDGDDNDGVAAWYLVFDEDSVDKAYEYTLTFTPKLEGEWDSTNSEIDEIEDKSLTLFGKEYSIINAIATSATGISLELMGGSTLDTLEEGESKTYTIDGNDYEVKALIISDTANSGNGEAKFSVNGEVTEGLAEGETYTLNDGTEIGIREILPNEAGETTGGDLVEFYIGADKVDIVDSDVTTDDWGGTLEVGDESNEAVADITGTSTATDGAAVYINSIKVKYTPTEELYVPVGGSASEDADDAEGNDGNFLLHGFDIIFEGMEGGDMEEVRFLGSEDQYRMKMTNKMGNEFTMDLVGYDETLDKVFWGKEGSTDYDLILTTDTDINKKEYFILSNKGNYKTRVFRYDKINTNDETIELTDETTGNELAITYDATTKNATETIDGNSYIFTINAGTVASDSPIYVESLGTNGVMNELYTQHEAIVYLNTTQWNLTNTSDPTYNTALVTVFGNDDQDNVQTRDNVRVKIKEKSAGTELEAVPGGSGGYNANGVTLADATVGTSSGSGAELAENDDSDVTVGYTYPYGLGWEYDTNVDNPTVTITHPENFMVAQVFVTAGVVETTTIEGEATTTIQRIDVGAAKLASEMASATAQNVISVGGSCVNKVTADLLGLSYPTCGAASTIPENGAILKMVESGEKVGLIVAGWTADDTRRATTVLGDFESYALSGAEVWVTGTSLSDITVSAPSAVEEVVEEETMDDGDAMEDDGEETTE